VWGFGYLLFVGVMQKGGYLEDGKATGIGTYFALGIAIGIPAILAMVVLVLPGLYLWMRWLPAYSRALLSYDGIGNSMRWAWDRTERFQKPLFIGILLPASAYAVSLGAALGYDYFYESFDWSGYVAMVVVWNVTMSVGVAWMTIFGIAAYGLVTGRDGDAADSFA
jgi:uncharacterized membrane protein (Fun14 family)